MSEGQADKYEVLEKIGQGSFGVIRKVKRKADGHVCHPSTSDEPSNGANRRLQVLCRKEINYLKMSQKEREQLQAELAVLKGLRHPNIVAYYEREHIKSTMDLHIYMEYCEAGDLGKTIKDLHKKQLLAEEDFVWSVFAQLVTALYRCHYGEDPPEVGKNTLGLGGDARPTRPRGSHTMILHRDLKPENSQCARCVYIDQPLTR
jgi:serine/threonine protein kinase